MIVVYCGYYLRISVKMKTHISNWSVCVFDVSGVVKEWDLKKKWSYSAKCLFLLLCKQRGEKKNAMFEISEIF